MGKYRRKQYYVDAVPYEKGMEDIMLPICKKENIIMFEADCRENCTEYDICDRNKAIIIKPHISGKEVKENDYIITEDGNRRVISKEELERDYDFICK